MNCFNNTIGVKGCGVTPPSKRYLNLPGITTSGIDQTASSDQKTYLQAFIDAQSRALEKMRTAVISGFTARKKYRIKSVPYMADLGRIIDVTNNQTSSQAQYRGFTVDLTFKDYAKHLHSSLQSIYIKSLSLYAKAVVADVWIRIFGLDTGVKLDEFKVTTVANDWVTKDVSKYYDALRVLIAYDATGIDSVSQALPATAQSTCNTCTTMIYNYQACDAVIKGAQTVNLTNVTAPVPGSNLFGLTGVISVRCTYDWVVCNNIDLFMQAWEYLLGAELMIGRDLSDRINPFTTVAEADIEKQIAYFLQEHQKELNAAIDGIDVDLRDCCLSCEPDISYKPLRP